VLSCIYIANLIIKPVGRLDFSLYLVNSTSFVLWQIETCWMDNFASKYPDGIESDDLDVLMQSLVSKVKSRKVYLHLSETSW
jgi:hypothetical protein